MVSDLVRAHGTLSDAVVALLLTHAREATTPGPWLVTTAHGAITLTRRPPTGGPATCPVPGCDLATPHLHGDTCG